MDLFCNFLLICISLYIAVASILPTKLNDYTYKYETFHHNLDISYLLNNTLSLSFDERNLLIKISVSEIEDSKNRKTILFDVNNGSHIYDLFDNDDWNEYHQLPNGTLFLPNGQRRRLWCRKRKRPPSRSDRYWRPQKIKVGRYIAYYAGRTKKWNYWNARHYCLTKYGGLAQIFNSKENALVQRGCTGVLHEHTTGCYDGWLDHGSKHKHWYNGKWRGESCWIGLFRKSAKYDSKWTMSTHEKIRWQNFQHSWSPRTPSLNHKWKCRRTKNGRCAWKSVYTWNGKCGAMIGRFAQRWQYGHWGSCRRRSWWSWKHYKCHYGVNAGWTLGKWRNLRCSGSKLSAVVCQQPQGYLIKNKYIIVRALRTWKDAEQYCLQTYGTHLATIESQSDNDKAWDACKRIDKHTPHCWIGLQRPFDEWNDGKKAVNGYTNWHPGEPNGKRNKENCAELYSEWRGRWNDLKCNQKRWVLCNFRSQVQRMKEFKPDDFEELVQKRLTRHNFKWRKHEEHAYRKKMRKQLWARIKKRKREQEKKKRQAQQKERERMRERLFNNIQTMDTDTIPEYLIKGGKRRRLEIAKRREQKQERKTRRNYMKHTHDLGIFNDEHGEEQYYFEGYDRIYEKSDDSDDYDNGYSNEILHAFGLNENDFPLLRQRKCVGLDGLYEMCVSFGNIEIKKYIGKEKKNHIYQNVDLVGTVDNNTMGDGDYIAYVNSKHAKAHWNASNDYDYDDNNNNNTLLTHALIGREYAYNPDDNNHRQCWGLYNPYDICLEFAKYVGDTDIDLESEEDDLSFILEIDEEIDFDIDKSDLYAKSIHMSSRFNVDSDWDEINKIMEKDEDDVTAQQYIDENVQVTVQKCKYILNSKVCIQQTDTHFSVTALIPDFVLQQFAQ